MPTRGSSSCWTLVENSQLSGRALQPARVAGSNTVLGRGCPKLRSEIRPHSPLACGSRMLQSGVKSRSASVQDLVTVVARLEAGLPVVGAVARTYRPIPTLSAVFPVPNRSYEAPTRGVRSL